MSTFLNYTDIDFEQHLKAIINQARGNNPNISADVRDIIENIRKDGDAALLSYTRKFDDPNADLAQIKLSASELQDAESAIDVSLKSALKLAHDRIASFHQKLTPEHIFYTDETGTQLGMRYTPIEAAGVYIPGGAANYPSSVLMNIIPAKIAGVSRIVATVPAPMGKIDPFVIYALHLAGAHEVYKVGGAQAIAALAYGTETIQAVDKITGPGNAYVAEAKKQVYGIVGIDSIAGPSEIMVIADQEAHPYHTAIDLLSQCEHDPYSQAVLICLSAEFADQVTQHISSLLETLPRKEIASKSWKNYGVVIQVPELEVAAHIANLFAPEHLQLSIADPELLIPHIKHAGAIFMGYYTPEAIGDYVAGPNHVLPTNRNPRFSSGLSTMDFMKRTSLIQCSAESFAQIAPAAITLADAEGLEAHRLSCAIRQN